MRTRSRIDQLRGNAHSVPAPSHRAFKNVADAKLAPDLLHVNRLALVGETGIAGYDEEPADAGEGSDNFLDHPVRKIIVLRVATHVLEGQYGYRRFIGER